MRNQICERILNHSTFCNHAWYVGASWPGTSLWWMLGFKKKKKFLIVSSSRLLWVMELLHVCGWNLKNLRPCLNTLCNLVSYYQTHCEYKVTHLVQFREAKVRNTEIPLADEKYLLLTILLKTDVGFIQKATCPYRCITLFFISGILPKNIIHNSTRIKTSWTIKKWCTHLNWSSGSPPPPHTHTHKFFAGR